MSIEIDATGEIAHITRWRVESPSEKQDNTNYKALLKKYIQFVGEYEGSTFVDNLDSPMSDVEFTDEEVKVLEGIDREIWNG